MSYASLYFSQAIKFIAKAVTALLAMQSAVGQTAAFESKPGALTITTALEPAQVRNNLFLGQHMTHFFCAQVALAREPLPCGTVVDSYLSKRNQDATVSYLSAVSTSDSKAHLDYTEVCQTEETFNVTQHLIKKTEKCGSFRNSDFLLFTRPSTEQSHNTNSSTPLPHYQAG